MPGLSQFELEFHAGPSRAGTGTLRCVQLATGRLQYRFVRARRRTMGIVVRRGEVEARAPRYVTVAEVEAFLRVKERWIARRLALALPEAPRLRWSDGTLLPLLGRPARLIDYVVAHEMAHLRELNHSARFWAVVAGIFPDYLYARRELKRTALPTL